MEERKEGWMIRVDGQDRTVGSQIRETSDEAGSDRISQGIKPLKMFCFETAAFPSCTLRLDLIVEMRAYLLYIYI